MLWHLSYFQQQKVGVLSIWAISHEALLYWLHWAAYFIWVFSNKESAFICENIFWQRNRMSSDILLLLCLKIYIFRQGKCNCHLVCDNWYLKKKKLSERGNTSVIWYLTIFKQGKHACHLRLDSYYKHKHFQTMRIHFYLWFFLNFHLPATPPPSYSQKNLLYQCRNIHFGNKKGQSPWVHLMFNTLVSREHHIWFLTIA